MPHVLVVGKVHDSGIDLLRSRRDVTFDYLEDASGLSYLPLIGKAEGLVIRTQPLTAAAVAEAPKLRIVSRHGVGYDSVDLSALNARGIALAVVGDVNSVSVAEQAMTLLLAASKCTVRADRAVRETGWSWRNRLEPREIRDRRLLIVGFGRSGRHLAKMAAGFRMQVRAFDPVLAEKGWPDGPVPPVADLGQGLAWADCVSLHVPSADRPIIGAQELAAMKPGAILVNTSRGGVIDEAALIAALRENRLGAAGLDVFEDEPPAADNPLLSIERVVLSPHVAGLTAESAERMAVSSVQNVLDFFADCLDPALVVNPGVGDGR